MFVCLFVCLMVIDSILSNRDGDLSVRSKRTLPSKCFKHSANRNSWTWSRASCGCAGRLPPENSIWQPPLEWDNPKNSTAPAAVVATAVAIHHHCSTRLPVDVAVRAVRAALAAIAVRMAIPVDCISAFVRCRSASATKTYWSPARRWNCWSRASKCAVRRNWLRSTLCRLLKVISLHQMNSLTLNWLKWGSDLFRFTWNGYSLRYDFVVRRRFRGGNSPRLC